MSAIHLSFCLNLSAGKKVLGKSKSNGEGTSMDLSAKIPWHELVHPHNAEQLYTDSTSQVWKYSGCAGAMQQCKEAKSHELNSYVTEAKSSKFN